MSLSNKALLVHLTISQWTGRKLDRAATESAERAHNAQTGAGNYTKKLLPGAEQLATIQSESNALRAWFYDNTLPWATDGTRILKSSAYLEFTNEFRTRKGRFDSAVADFVREYPLLKDAARLKLGDLFRETEYPTIAGLQGAFQCEISFMPMPDVGDFRVEILDSEKDAFLKRMQDVQTHAMRDCWDRLHAVVSKAASKLSQPDAIFRDSLIENVREICGLLPKLNLTDDANLEAMRQSVEKAIGGLTAKDVRENVGARTDAARALAAIESQMGAFMGAGN